MILKKTIQEQDAVAEGIEVVTIMSLIFWISLLVSTEWLKLLREAGGLGSPL